MTAPDSGTTSGGLPAGTDVAVRIRGLRKAYGGVAAVDGIDLDIARGETFALLGPNGAGKSTTIEILEGYRLRTAGEVSVLGIDPAHGGLDWKARLGIVLQSATESGVFTVREQLTHFAGFYPDPRDVDEVIAAVGLEAKARTRIGEALRRPAPTRRRRPRHHRPPRAALPRRADHRLRPRGPPRVLGAHPRRSRPRAPRSCSPPTTSTRRPSSATARASSSADDSSTSAASTSSAAPRRACPSCAGATPTARRARSAPSDRPSSWHPSSHEHGGEPDALEVIRPSLEDIYLHLVHAAGADTHDDEEALA